MQIENELKESMLLLHRIYDQATLNGRVTPELYKDISDRLNSIDLALGKPEPLAKNKQCESLDLEELQRKLDEVLDSETSESLKEWLKSKRSIATSR